MPRGPVRPDRQELLVGCSRFFVFPAIAEYPGTQISDFFFFGLQIEGTAGALDCNVAAVLVVERLAQLRIDPGALLIGDIGAPETNKACLEVAHRSRADDGLSDLANVAQLGGTLAAGPSLTLCALSACSRKGDRSNPMPLTITSLRRNVTACASAPTSR